MASFSNIKKGKQSNTDKHKQKYTIQKNKSLAFIYENRMCCILAHNKTMLNRYTCHLVYCFSPLRMINKYKRNGIYNGSNNCEHRLS